MHQPYFIGIDQGSSSTKALAVSEQGQVLFQTKRIVPVSFREGELVESDPAIVLASVQDVLKETVANLSASGSSPAGIGLACQRSSCLIWNETDGAALSNVISWRDLRGAPYIDSLRDRAETVLELSGLPLTPYYAASKLRWLSENNPEARRHNAVLGTLSSFLAQRLTGGKQAVIDHTQAARTQLMNIRTLQWDDTLRSLFGLGEAKLPTIVPALRPYGVIETPAGAVPLRVCIGDQQAAMVGLGVLEQGDGGINYGTGGFLMTNTGDRLVPAKGLMASVHYSSESTRRYLLEGSVNAAGDALEWLRSRMHLFTEYEELDDLCWQAATDVVAFIGLNGTGAPHWESGITSSVQGLTAESSAADIVRGTVEGIAFFMKDIEQAIRNAGAGCERFAVSGGLSSLTYLVQVQADILQRELRVAMQQEVTSLGAALLAGMDAAVWSEADIKKIAGSGEAVAPRVNPGVEKRYRRWRELHRMTRQLDAE